MLKHSFSPDVKDFYLLHDLTQCVSCGRWGCELHHILGRRHEENASIYNSSLLCRECHNRKNIHQPTIQKDLLNKTADILMRYNYTLKEIDIKFITENYEHFRPEVLPQESFNNIDSKV